MRPLHAFACALSILTPTIATSQAPVKEEFEVAAIRPFAPDPGGGFPVGPRGGPGTSDPGRISYLNLTLKYLLIYAYDVKEYQVDSPAWMNEIPARFVIEATVRPGATKEQVNRMLQNLLAERFKLTLHHATKDYPHRELTIAKDGPKLKESTDDPATRPGLFSAVMARTGSQRITAKNQTVEQLADRLSSPALGPVLDRTGLTKKYDFTLEYAASDTTLASLRRQGIAVPAEDAAPGFPDLQGALQEQLGLKIEAKKGPIEMLVVDHCEKQPTDN